MLRNYLKTGILVAEKEEGTWSFTDEQVSAFLENEYVRPAIKAKRNAVLFDYLEFDPSSENTACIVLRLTKEDSGDVADFFCNAVTRRNGLTMTFDENKGENKVILVGDLGTVYSVIAEYHAVKKH